MPQSSKKDKISPIVWRPQDMRRSCEKTDRKRIVWNREKKRKTFQNDRLETEEATFETLKERNDQKHIYKQRNALGDLSVGERKHSHDSVIV